jgi:hypothetical protein
MAVLGIITCEILELEFARLLGEAREIGCISVLEDRHSARLINLLEAQSIECLQRLPHVSAFRAEPDEPLEVLVRVLALGLHRNGRVLRHALSKAAHELQLHSHALLLGYGLCGNALDDPRSVIDVDIPLFLPMDDDHPLDDCVALCLGGRECYYAEQRKVAGTFFLTPGWSEHWKQMLDTPSGQLSQPGLKRVLSGYERALLVQTPALDDAELLQRGDEFSQRTGLRLESIQGTMDPLTSAWIAARDFILPNSSVDRNEAAK